MKKYTLLAALAFSALTVTATPKENTSQGNPQEMDKFITELMGKMTLHEKIGQLNLPVTGNIVTGHPLAVRYGRDSRLRNGIPHPLGTLVQLGHGGYREIGPYRRH